MTNNFYKQLLDDNAKFISVFNFLLDTLEPREAIMLSTIIGITSVPHLKRLSEDQSFFEVRLFNLRSWGEEEIVDSLETLKDKDLIDYLPVTDGYNSSLAVKLNTQNILKLKEKFEDKISLKIAI